MDGSPAKKKRKRSHGSGIKLFDFVKSDVNIPADEGSKPELWLMQLPKEVRT